MAPNRIKNPLQGFHAMLKSQNWCECQKMWLIHLFQAYFNFWSFFQTKWVCYHHTSYFYEFQIIKPSPKSLLLKMTKIWFTIFKNVNILCNIFVHVCMCICMYVSMYVLFCFVWMFCMYIVCIYMYLFICMYICMYVLCICIFLCLYIYVCSSVHIYVLSMNVLVHTCLYKSHFFNCLSCRYLGCYLLVWYCYLRSILAFSFKFLNMNTNTCTKSST